MAPKLGIIAGGGPLPGNLATACEASGRDCFVLALNDQTDPKIIEPFPHKWIRMGEIRRGIEILREEGVTELVFIGPVKRPSLRELKLDAWAIRKAAMLGLRWIGDDSILSTLVKGLEEEGFSVVGAETILEDSVALPGAYGVHAPDEEQWPDIRHGVRIARAVGELDIGQGAVVQQGIVLGVEGIDGTDALIRRCAPLQRSGTGAVLVKSCKPQQERRIDLPTIGPGTIEILAEAGFSGVAVEAGRALILDREEVVRSADESGLFVIGVDP